jgi:hypothetical protein
MDGYIQHFAGWVRLPLCKKLREEGTGLQRVLPALRYGPSLLPLTSIIGYHRAELLGASMPLRLTARLASLALILFATPATGSTI